MEAAVEAAAAAAPMAAAAFSRDRPPPGTPGVRPLNPPGAAQPPPPPQREVAPGADAHRPPPSPRPTLPRPLPPPPPPPPARAPRGPPSTPDSRGEWRGKPTPLPHRPCPQARAPVSWALHTGAALPGPPGIPGAVLHPTPTAHFLQPLPPTQRVGGVPQSPSSGCLTSAHTRHSPTSTSPQRAAPPGPPTKLLLRTRQVRPQCPRTRVTEATSFPASPTTSPAHSLPAQPPSRAPQHDFSPIAHGATPRPPCRSPPRAPSKSAPSANAVPFE